MKQLHFTNRFLAIIVALSVLHYSCNEVETIQNTKRPLSLEQDNDFQRLVAIQLEINERVANTRNEMDSMTILSLNEELKEWGHRPVSENDIVIVRKLTGYGQYEMEALLEEVGRVTENLHLRWPHYFNDTTGLTEFFEIYKTQISGINFRADCCGCDGECDQICNDYTNCINSSFGVAFGIGFGASSFGGTIGNSIGYFAGGYTGGTNAAANRGAQTGRALGGAIGAAIGLVVGAVNLGNRLAECERRRERDCRLCPCQ